jgi:hypothetical protein
VAWGIVYYRRADDSVPAEEFLDACPPKIAARLLAVLEAVRAAPPPAFSGGGMWEAMHGSMNGYYEIRVSGPGRAQFRLFCILDNAEAAEDLERLGFSDPQIAVINGMEKPVGELFSDGEYRRRVRDLGAEYRAQVPRRIA